MNIGSFSKNIEKSATGLVSQIIKMPSTLASWGSTPPREPSFSTFFGPHAGEGDHDKRPQEADYSQLGV